MNDYLKRTWAVINLNNLEFNITKIIQSLPSNTKIMGVVKADGYGHGDRFVAQTLVACGVDFLAVSNLDEAMSLRHSGIECDILILGFTPIQMVPMLHDYHITQTIFSTEYAVQLNTECARLNLLIDAHIKIDTGMGRLGVTENIHHSATQEIASICSLKQLHVQGIFTHLSSADSLDESSIAYTSQQIEYYDHILTQLEQKGIIIPLKHVQNSAGIAFVQCAHYDYARAGIVMYGVAPSDEAVPFHLRPVMELKSVVSMVKYIEAGTPVSYGRNFIADKKMKVATVPIGYADGYPRSLSNKGYMLIHGKRANIIGNICMDQLMIDVSDIDDVNMGDIITLVGIDGDEQIGFGELSSLISSISYEMMCLIGKRVPRVYKKNGNIIDVTNFKSVTL